MSAPSPQPGLTFTFLGFPRVYRGSDLASGERFHRPMALLALLAASSGPRSREEIVSYLWPEKSLKAALANLSTTLYNLDSRLGEGVLEKTLRTVEWKESSLSWEEDPVDLRRYQREDPPWGCESFHSPLECPRCRERIELRREMGRRTFLEGVSLAKMGPYELWVGSVRKRLALIQERLERQLSSRAGSTFALSPPVFQDREIRQSTLLSILFSSAPGVDPEDILGLRNEFRERIEPVVLSAGGVLRAGPEGSLLAVFGVPRVLEDGARRAVRVAREINALALSDVRFRKNGVCLALHTGVGLSDLVVGDPDLVGAQIREVDRIVRQARPGEIMMTQETARQVDRFYVLLRAGVLPAGGEGPERSLYRIREERYSLAGSEVNLIGRKREISRMETMFAEAKREKRLRSLWITGEAGIGKSALLESFMRRAGRQGGEGSVRLISCLSEYQESPYSSVTRFLRGYIGLEEGLSAQETRYRIERYLLSTRQPVERHLPLLLHFLCGSAFGSEEIAELSPDRLRDRIENLVLSILTARSESPFLLAIEDFHWMDKSTLGLLKKTIDAVRQRPVFLVLTSREEGILLEAGIPPPDEILCLGGLTRSESRQMIESLSSEVPSPSALKEALDRGGGVPLYLRELVLTGALSLGAAGVPPTLKDLLASRIDSLKKSRVMAKIAACLGQSVDWPLLLRTTERYAGLRPGDPASDLWLRELVEMKILSRDSSLADPVYEFRHALLRETVLDSLPGSVRRGIHGAIARTLREEFSSRADLQPEVLGEHFFLAGEPEEAFSFFIKAGDHASGVGAYRIALFHFEQAMKIIEGGANLSDAATCRVKILLAMIQIAMEVWGIASSEVELLTSKLQDMADRDPDPFLKNKLSSILIGLGSGLYGPSWVLERTASDESAQISEHSATRLWVACVRGSALFWRGQLDRSLSELEALRPSILALRDGSPDSAESYSAEPPAVLFYSYMGFVCQLMGRIRDSRVALEEGSRLDDFRRFPKSRVFLGVFATYSECMAHNRPEAERLARETLKLAEDFGLHMWEEVCRLALFWCDGSKAAAAGSEAAVKSIRGMLPGVIPCFTSLYAETVLSAGMCEKAIETARMGREEGKKTGTTVFDPLFRIVEGSALLGIDPRKRRDEAISLFEEARMEAEKNGALWYVLLAERGLASIGRGDEKRRAALLARFQGGENLFRMEGFPPLPIPPA